ncbi:lactonase family protein, partial [Nitrospira sp. NS4]|uniref:lactonase family protein n=1 Tax=Nitrospira sp. NS4 TaxID=3414498 RepID=UPI003C2E3EA1
SPVAAGTAPSSVTVDPTGRWAYVANQSSNDVSAYTINSATGALTAVNGSPFATESRPASGAVDMTGRWAYVANSTSNNVSAYRIEGTTGLLTFINTFVDAPPVGGSVSIVTAGVLQ